MCAKLLNVNFIWHTVSMMQILPEFFQLKGMCSLIPSLTIQQWWREPLRIKDDLSPQHLSPQSRCYCFSLVVNSTNHDAHRERRKWNSSGLARTSRRCSRAERFNEDWPAPPLLNHNKSWKNNSVDTFHLNLLLCFVFRPVLYDTLGCALQFILVYITFP